MTTKDSSISIDTLPAGEFATWLQHLRARQHTPEGTDVPCGSCRGCCTSSYFIHIKPDEAETLAAIPKRLLFPAPGLPKGHMLMGYNEQGHCPMFADDVCTIYEQRPQTCRDYDCRVFAAVGLPAGDEQNTITRQAARWTFDKTTVASKRAFAAVRTAIRFLRQNAAHFPAGFFPTHTTQQAIMALQVHDVFLDHTDEPLDIETMDEASHRELIHAICKAHEDAAANAR